MFSSLRRWLPLVSVSIGICLPFGNMGANEPDPNVMTFKLPKDLQWKGPGRGGAESVILFGDPSKEGIYGELTKWYPHKMSRPHFHPNDRYIYVISGTWWVGSGPKYDPDSTYPMPTGSYVHHIAKQIHYDGNRKSVV